MQNIRPTRLRPVVFCDSIVVSWRCCIEKKKANKVKERMRKRNRKNSGHVTTTEGYSDAIADTTGKLGKCSYLTLLSVLG